MLDCSDVGADHPSFCSRRITLSIVILEMQLRNPMRQAPRPLAASPRVACEREPRFFLSRANSVFGPVDLLFSLCVAIFSLTLSTCMAAEDLPEGFQRVKGKYVDVITDLPLDAEIRSLPSVFDAAMPRWCEEFDMDLSDVADWHVEAFVMLRRDQFKKAGFIPSKLPEFPYGFQFGNQVWVVEQPSPYYRRHLLLHEGTHWFMNRKYGDHGPPWLMEGTAEWLGTHRWDGQKLMMGIIPKTKTDVEYWGRISLIQQQLADGVAPSLEEVLRYDSRAHQNVEAYAWSWAAVIFLKNHPATSKAFAELLKQKMTSDQTLTRWLFRKLQSQWPQIRREWSGMLTELEYGYDPRHGMLAISRAAKPIGDTPIAFELAADHSWQTPGVKIAAGDTVVIQGNGQFSVCDQPKPWLCHAAGVTLEYYRGEPLGKLMMTVAGPQEKEQFSQPIEVVAVGDQLEFTAAQAGELHFRINESSGGLGDNSGTITVTIRKP